nr:hypothetical protein [Celeribacter baekdonensis]
MDNIAGKKSSLTWAVHISVAILVFLWMFPTVGLLVSSFRSADQISGSGWWKALFPQEQNVMIRTSDPEKQQQIDGAYVIEGNLFEQDGLPIGTVSVWGTSSRDISAYKAGDTADLGKDGQLTVAENGDYTLLSETEFTGSRGSACF